MRVALLDPRETLVLRLRFGIDASSDHTPEEIGGHLAVTRERVQAQIEAKALARSWRTSAAAARHLRASCGVLSPGQSTGWAHRVSNGPAPNPAHSPSGAARSPLVRGRGWAARSAFISCGRRLRRQRRGWTRGDAHAGQVRRLSETTWPDERLDHGDDEHRDPRERRRAAAWRRAEPPARPAGRSPAPTMHAIARDALGRARPARTWPETGTQRDRREARRTCRGC